MTYFISRVLNRARYGNYIALVIVSSWGLPIDWICLVQTSPLTGSEKIHQAGMWILRDSSQCLVLKLVPCRLMGPSHCSESDKLLGGSM